MPNEIKSKPVGIDIPIQSFQKFLYNKLKVLWPVDDTNFEGYGKVYRNANDKGYVPQLFVSSTSPENTVYKDLFFDKSRLKALFFFDKDDKTFWDNLQGAETAKVSLIFIVNLEQLKDKIAHRGDEEVRNDVEKLCSLNAYNFILTGTETGFKNVFRAFDGLVNKDNEVFEDRHPLYCLKLNFDLFYQPTQVPC